MQAFNNRIGAALDAQFAAMGSAGEDSVVRVASSTFWPVNQCMFGAETLNPSNLPDAESLFHQFDENVPKVAGGVPAKLFDGMQEARDKVVAKFQDSIDAGNHTKDSCPVMKARVDALGDNAKDFSNETLAKFMFSLFWAPQANTLPMTCVHTGRSKERVRGGGARRERKRVVGII